MVNGDPYRNTPTPADRRVINRSGAPAAYRPAEEPQPKEEAPKSVPRVSSSYRSEREDSPKKSSKWAMWLIIAAVIIAGLGIGGWLLFSNAKNGATGIDSTRYQAVFLTNGQIYFGKLSAYNEESLRLTTGYYPQAKATDTDTKSTAVDTTSASGIQLIRLGDEVYGPENEIFISKKQILHYENLKTDSKVSQLIDQNEKAKQ